MNRTILQFLIATALVFAIMMTLKTVTKGEEMTSDNWFALIVGIERDIAKADAEHRMIRNLDHEDRRFIRKMANDLTAHENAKPTPAQGQWLLSIRAWIDGKTPHLK